MDTYVDEYFDESWGKVPELVAQNDESYCYCQDCPAGLTSDALVENVIRLMTDAPLDFPARDDAIIGLSAALKVLEPELPSISMLSTKISEAISFVPTNSTATAVVVALSRRKGYFMIYALVREIGSAVKNGRLLDSDLLKIVGINCLRHLLSGYQPSPQSIANLRHGLLFFNGKNSQSWAKAARARALSKARQSLGEALECNPKAAVEYGLANTLIRPERSFDPIEVFNRAYRRRTENLIDFASLDAVAAAGGYDTLSESALLYAGQQVLNMALAGDHRAVLVGMEVITHLTSECVLMIPIQRGQDGPEGALAWLNLDLGIYCQVQYHIQERGAKVEPGTEHLYEKTTDVVTIHLSPPFHRHLLEMDHASNQTAVNVEGLIGAVGHHPRSAVVKGAGYRITARRMQESVPTILLQEGHHRWPVALATNSHFLVTRGRRAYGACSAVAIHRITNRTCELLGWPKPTGSENSALVGTPTVPKNESVSGALNFLCKRADHWSIKMDSYDSVCIVLNANAHWLAMLEALVFALRQWNVYLIKLKQIANGELVKFSDKDVHEYQGPGVPVVLMMLDAATGWMSLCRDAIKLLRGFSDPESVELAERLENYLADKAPDIGFVAIDAIGNLKPVGHKTWCDALPGNIRLKPNFARQYWPLKLMDLGVEQSVMDLLMRHQLDRLPPGTSRSLKILDHSMSTLHAAMEVVIASLNLCMPSKLKGGHHGQ